MKKYLSLVKFSHTIFAMPFAMIGFFMGVQENKNGLDWKLFGLVIVCMVTARNAAMGFNRYLDRNIDALNPRTINREIPSGQVRPSSALAFVIINALIFSMATYFINPLCFMLSPVALAVVLGYSFTKRFTALCHLVLGIGLALAPIGAFLAVTGVFRWLPVLYGFLVLCWVAGFDIIYALQDEEFDKSQDLHSIPSLLGKKNALWVAKILHLICAVLIIYCVYSGLQQYPTLGILHILGGGLFILFLIYQHSIVKPNDLQKVNLAFFTSNGVASVIFGLLFVIDVLY